MSRWVETGNPMIADESTAMRSRHWMSTTSGLHSDDARLDRSCSTDQARRELRCALHELPKLLGISGLPCKCRNDRTVRLYQHVERNP